ncbi:hypothetical protein M0R45_010075 [Rubus argutus]|uniref:Uncharacterized protein n=1 Tax=Rubus argutus TaxID=59490 RepID=A0AAW1Y6Y7_RUBAR
MEVSSGAQGFVVFENSRTSLALCLLDCSDTQQGAQTRAVAETKDQEGGSSGKASLPTRVSMERSDEMIAWSWANRSAQRHLSCIHVGWARDG